MYKNGSVTTLSSADDPRDVVTFRVSERPVRVTAQLVQGEMYLAYKQVGESARICAGEVQKLKDMVPVPLGTGYVSFTGDYMQHTFTDPGEYALVFQWSPMLRPAKARKSLVTKQPLAVKPNGC